MNDETLKMARQLADIARTIPKTWTDSKNWHEHELGQVAGLIEFRWRVNGSPPVDRVYILSSVNSAISFKDIEATGIKDAISFHLIAVRSIWGHDFPEVLDAEQASRILEGATPYTVIGNTIEAVFRHGRNERDDSPFIFSEWAPELLSDAPITLSESEMPVPEPHKWHTDYFTVSELADMRKAVKLPYSPSTMTREIEKEIEAERIQRDGNKPMRIRIDLYDEWSSKRGE
jgi:hypothetical protein